jgi:hypothetical protein
VGIRDNEQQHGITDTYIDIEKETLTLTGTLFNRDTDIDRDINTDRDADTDTPQGLCHEQKYRQGHVPRKWTILTDNLQKIRALKALS